MNDKDLRDTMNSFAPSEAQKERIYEKVTAGDSAKRYGRGGIKWACAAAACAVLAAALVLALNGPYKTDHASTGQTGGMQTQQASANAVSPSAAQADAAFRGFVLTAYRPAGTEYLGADYEQEAERVSLAPDVQVLLAKYSPLMSSVPGLPFTIDMPDDLPVDTIRVTVDNGALCEWDQATGAVTQKGSAAEITAGGTIYWSPLDGDSADVTEATVTVEAAAGGVTVGRQQIRVTQDALGYYCATAGQPEDM
jgi:hypothetical protein